jgi:tRNA-2-methylthio-N6-dimethylallyladenosine synthase
MLVEGFSKKSNQFLSGRTDTNKVVIIPLDPNIREGDYVKVKIDRATSATLFGRTVESVEHEEKNMVLSA